MAKEIKAGSTDQTIDVFVQDSSSTIGAGLTGLAYDTTSLTCYYRKGATGTWAALSLATQTIDGAHSDGGFVEGDATNAPGMYRLDLSDTMVAAAGLLKIYLRGAADMAPTIVEIEVVSVDKYDATSLGLSRLDAAISSRLASTDAPTNFSALGINASGHISRVTLADRVTTNTDMRGTDSANTTTPPTVTEIRTEIDANSTQLDGIRTDTEDLQSRTPAALVGGRMSADVGSIEGATEADSGVGVLAWFKRILAIKDGDAEVSTDGATQTVEYKDRAGTTETTHKITTTTGARIRS